MKVKEQDTIKYIFKEFLIEVKKEILEMGQDEQFCKNIENCINEIELESILRDRVFHSDDKTQKFLDKIRKKISKEESDISEQPELSENEFSEFLYDCLEKSSKLKNSKFKITNHYFSTEKDLVIKIQMNDKKETQFRILNIKA